VFDFVKVADIDDIKPGRMKLVELGGERVVLVNVDGSFYAIGADCTHKGGPLDEGELEGEIITCPLHGGQFNVKTGEDVLPPPRRPVPTYRVQVEGRVVKIARAS